MVQHQSAPVSTRECRRGPSSLVVILWAAASAAGLFLLWRLAPTFLLIFAGLLFGVLLDACARGLAYVLPIARVWRVAIVCVALAGFTAALLAWGGYSLAMQVGSLLELLERQITVVREHLESIGFRRLSGGQAEALREMIMPDGQSLSGHAQTAVGTVFGLVSSAVLILFVGLFVATDPDLYRRGILRLIPQAWRERIGEVMDAAALMLRWWLLGQMAAMALVAATTWLVLWTIGLPGSLLLGLQAGFMNFIPYLGPILGGIPIFLAAMSQGGEMLLWVMGAYIIVQILEGYVIAPMIQGRAVDLPPALTLSAIVIAGALFGALGVALATPLLAVIRIAVVKLYIEDGLGERPTRLRTEVPSAKVHDGNDQA
jgi:predicted PurR-regulated permease PerM